MIVFLNQQFVDESQATVSVFDRGFTYGDGLFETIPVYGGRPFRLDQHLDRMQNGLEHLRFSKTTIDTLPTARKNLEELIRLNLFEEGTARISITRGVGRRGYSAKGSGPVTLCMTLHCRTNSPTSAFYEAHSGSPPDPMTGLRLGLLSNWVWSQDPLLHFKTLNKMANILAKTRAEEAGYEDNLLLNEKNELTEATSANFFWVNDGAIFTPPVSSGILPGITRGIVFELSRKHGWKCIEQVTVLKEVMRSEGCFLTNSAQGIIPVASINGELLRTSQIISELAKSYWSRVREEVSIQ